MAVPQLPCLTDFFQSSFFPSAICEWNNLDINIQNSEFLPVFKKYILSFIEPSHKSVFDIRDNSGLQLLTRLRLGLSHLREHKFIHGFQDTPDPYCTCNHNIESTTHFFLHCNHYIQLRDNLKNDLSSIDPNLINLCDNELVNILLYGDPKYDLSTNRKILQSSIKFICNTDRFNVPLV